VCVMVTRHMEGPRNPDGPNLGIYVFVHVCEVHKCIYMLGGGMRSWTNSFFSLTHFSSKKQSKRFESKTEKPNPSYSNPQPRVLIYLFQSDKSSKACVQPTHSLFPFQRGATQNTLH